jgi:hypothetical protein
MALRVGVGWSTHFARTGAARLQYRRLRYAYRAPSYFLDGMAAQKSTIDFALFDEDLDASGLTGTQSLAAGVDLLYVASHGVLSPSGYNLALHAADWPLLTSSFGDPGPAVVVFDTCDLVDTRRATWMDDWRDAGVGRALRLILGFSSPATVSQQASLRGMAFASGLGTLTISDAWLNAVQTTRYVGTDKPVALAFGDDDADAQSVLDTATIGSIPGPRSSAVPGVAWAG